MIERAFPPLPETPEQSARIGRADEALAGRPDDPDAIVEAALAREEVWRYREAVELYSRGMEVAPEDYRMPLGRGHRLLRLRRLDEALGDLDRARELDPYGFNTAYLGALGRYLLGDFEAAVGEYERALELSLNESAGSVPGDPRHVGYIQSDPATRAAFTAWYYRALRRAGRHREAASLLDRIDVDAPPGEPDRTGLRGTLIRHDSNEPYRRTLLLYRGLRSESDVLDRDELGGQWTTVAYGVAVWRQAEGERDRAIELLKEISAEPHWARLGHVAAEVDLQRV